MGVLLLAASKHILQLQNHISCIELCSYSIDDILLSVHLYLCMGVLLLAASKHILQLQNHISSIELRSYSIDNVSLSVHLCFSLFINQCKTKAKLPQCLAKIGYGRHKFGTKF